MQALLALYVDGRLILQFQKKSFLAKKKKLNFFCKKMKETLP
jgi:hypothetical protein